MADDNEVDERPWESENFASVAAAMRQREPLADFIKGVHEEWPRVEIELPNAEPGSAK